jgi:hypothetical protein
VAHLPFFLAILLKYHHRIGTPDFVFVVPISTRG